MASSKARPHNSWKPLWVGTSCGLVLAGYGEKEEHIQLGEPKPYQLRFELKPQLRGRCCWRTAILEVLPSMSMINTRVRPFETATACWKVHDSHDSFRVPGVELAGRGGETGNFQSRVD